MLRAIFLSFCLLLTPAGALAHRLNVFAWPEAGQIIVSCNFGSKRPAAGAEVKIYGAGGRALLAEGLTNERGEFAFPLPKDSRGGLEIEAYAGQGHKGEWKIEAYELSASSAPSPPEAPPAYGPRPAKPEPAAARSDGVSKEELQAIISEALAPLRRELAELRSGRPGVTEIVGGIGWILGLAGIALYFTSSKKK